MKVILADDIRGLGRRGDTVTVKPGYARNYLFPNKVAYEATDANVRRLGEEKKKYDERMMGETKVAQDVARQMDGLTVVLTKKAGEEGVLYGSVTASEIADALAPGARVLALHGDHVVVDADTRARQMKFTVSRRVGEPQPAAKRK